MKIAQKKKSNKLKYLIFLFISIYVHLFLYISGYSQTDSLKQYLEIAAKNNPMVLQKYYEYQAALQKIPLAGSLPDPELSMGIFLSPMEQVNGNQVADIRLMQMFPWFGVLKNAKDEMSLMANAKYESFQDSKLQVFYDVQRTWYELYKNQQNIYVSEKNIEVLHTIERLALAKFKSGTAVSGFPSSSGNIMSNKNAQNGTSGMSGSMSGNAIQSSSNLNDPIGQVNNNQPSSMGSTSENKGLADLYRLQIEIGDLENNIALLRNQQNTIVARLNNYLNRPVQSTINLIDTLNPDTLDISLPAVSDSMLKNNPMLGMLQYEQQSLDARKKMVSRMSYPMVGLGVNYSLINKNNMSTSTMNGTDMIMPMVTVTLPIYRKKYKSMQSEADFLRSAAEQNYKAASNSLQTEYYEAVQLYQDAQRRIRLYENQSQLINKSLEIMIKSFSASGSGLTDILRIRQQILDYEFKQIEALVDNNTAVAKLKRLGNLNEVH
jgi:outer membrane protein TolC